MALTAEMIATLNNANVLAAYKAEQKAMLAIEAEAVALGIKKGDLIKAYNTEAKAVADTAKAQAKAAAGPSAWTLALKANTEAMQGNRAQINMLREGTGQLAGAIGLLSPELAVATQSLQKMQGVASAGAAGAQLLGVGLGTVAAAAVPLGLAIGAVGYAWNEHNKDAAEAKKRLDDAADAAKGAETAMDGLGDVIFENTVKQRVLDGVWTDAQASAVLASRSLADQYMPALEDLSKALEEAKAAETELMAERRITTEDLKSEHFQLRGVADAYNEVHEPVVKLQADYDKLNQRYVEANALQEETIKKTEAARVAKEKESEGAKAETKATKDATAAQREKEAADAKAAAALQSQHDAIISLTMSIEAAQDPYAKLLQKLDKIAAAEANGAVSAEEAARARTAAVAEWEAAVDKEVEAELAGIEKVKKAKEKAAEDAAADEKSRRKATINAIVGGASDMTAAIADGAAESYADAEDEIAALQERIDQATEDGDAAKVASLEKQKAFRQKALLKAFDEQKALTLTGISLNTAQAIMAALTAPPPAGQIAAAFATATGAIQFAQAAAEPPPTFEDTPGAVVAPVQNYAPTFKKKDIIIAAQSPTEVQRQAAALGGRPSGRRFVGAEIAENPIARDLRDLNRVTRGRVR